MVFLLFFFGFTEVHCQNFSKFYRVLPVFFSIGAKKEEARSFDWLPPPTMAFLLFSVELSFNFGVFTVFFAFDGSSLAFGKATLECRHRKNVPVGRHCGGGGGGVISVFFFGSKNFIFFCLEKKRFQWVSAGTGGRR